MSLVIILSLTYVEVDMNCYRTVNFILTDEVAVNMIRFTVQ